MTPTLAGRIQSRLVLLATIGVVWTLIIGRFVPGADTAPASRIYRALFTALLLTALIGIVWECVYHWLQQYRWEKDWPTMFGLLTAIPEGLVVWWALCGEILWDVGTVPGDTFLVHFVTLWLLIWAIANGPLQIVMLRWRYQGGRFFGGW